MVKKLFTLALGLAMAAGLCAQTNDSDISADNILYWVGEGESQAIFVLDLDGHAYAWGYRFDAADEPTVFDMVADIDQADPRFALGIDWSTYTYIYTYVEWPLKLSVPEEEARFKVDGTLADEDEMLTDYDLADGTLLRISNDPADEWNTPVAAATVATVPEDATIEASQVTYWVGSGAKSAVVVFDWSSNGRALAWGLHFDESVSVDSAFRMVADADPRLTFSMADNAYSFDGPFTHLQTAEGYLQYRLDGNGYTGPTDPLSDGSFLKIGESAYGTGWDSTEFYGAFYPASVVWTTRIDPVGAPFDTTEATLAASEVVYWVGEGSSRMVFAVNWADTALAWGYRFDGDSVTIEQAMNDIQQADKRFGYSASYGFINDITLTLGGKTYSVSEGSYWEHTLNGGYSAGLAQTIKDGDFSKWADPAAGVVVDSAYWDGWGWSYSYRYPMTIHAIGEPAGIAQAEVVEVTVYPNPVSQTLTVGFEALQQPTEAALYDLCGRRVASQEVAAGNGTVRFDVSSLADGTYLLVVGEGSAKIVVRH